MDKTTGKLSEFTGKLEYATHRKEVDDIARYGRRVKGCENLISRMQLMKANLQADWIWETKDDRWVFRPLWITKQLAERTFYAFGDRFIIMSATLPPVNIASFLLGAEEADGYGIEVDHPFPVENRQVIIRPRYSLTRASFDSMKERILDAHREILAQYPNDKILIHAVSYNLARLILSIGDRRMITHNSDDKEEAIQRFKESTKPLVMVSPSMTRGVDLHDDLARVIIWSKSPYLSLGDEITKRRANYGRFGAMWYSSDAAQSIVQGCGRGVRHAEDFAITYILDEKIKELVLRKTYLFPKWFIDSVTIEG
jgi:Rad3-related DNA helicase